MTTSAEVNSSIVSRVIGILVLAGAIGQMVAGFLPDILGWDQTIETRADATDNPLIPFGAAFLIWLPIFAGSIFFACRLLIAGPKDPSGLFSAAIPLGSAFWINTAYSLVSPLLGNQVLSGVLVIMILVPALVAMLRLPGDSLRGWADKTAAASVGLFAGWITVASTVSVVGILDGVGFLTLSAEVSPLVLVVLALGAGFAVAIGLKADFAWYNLAVGWGLFWLAVDALVFSSSPGIGVLAVFGCLVNLALTALFFWRSRGTLDRSDKVPQA